MTAVLVVGAIAATPFMGGSGGAAPSTAAAPAQAAATPGAATATAQILKINPRAGSLSLGITNGVSLSDYQNTVARAESRAVDLGIIGALLAAEGCDGGDPTLPADEQPQSVRAEARGTSASTGEVPEDKAGGTMTKFAEATPQPFSRAVTTTAARDIIPGLLSVGAGRSETITRFADGVRESIAITDLTSLSIAGGAVELAGLHWEAIHRSGAVNETIGTFTIAGGASRTVLQTLLGPILGPGAALPLDPSLLVTTIGQVLAPLGISLLMPTSFVATGIQFVDPLKIGIKPSQVRDGLLNTLLGVAAPVREPLIDAIFEADCSTQSLVTVVDVAIGTFTGFGDFHLELGGVQASTRDFTGTCFLCPGGGGGSLLPALPIDLPGLPTSPVLSSSPAVVPAGPATPAPAAAPTTAAEPRTRATGASGDRGGAMALVSLVGLGLLAGVAEGDRRKMRKAQRLIPVEA